MTQANENWVEMAILCNMMVKAEICAMALRELQEEYFADSRNRVIFRALQELPPHAEHRFEELTRMLNRNGMLESAGGKGYVTCVYLFIPVGDIESFIRLLLPKAA